MAFQRPSLTTLIDRVHADLVSRLGLAGTVLRRSVVRVVGRVLAGLMHGLYGFLSHISRQILPDTAEAEHLDRFASIWNVPRRAAEYASGDITMTGTDGSTAPAGTRLVRADGVEYVTDALATIAGGSATVAATAAAAGAGGDADAGVGLTFVSPSPGISTAATVAAGGITGGVDRESDTSLRGRILERIRAVPQGGAALDYERWAKEISGVTRVWVYPEDSGPGTVGVIVVTDDADPIIPDAAKVTEVQDHIDGVRPVTANVTVSAPTPVNLDLTITLTPNTAAVQAAVEAELEDMLRRDAEPGGTILLSRIREAISIAAGETDHTLNAPAADVTHQAGEIAVLGAITWQ